MNLYCYEAYKNASRLSIERDKVAARGPCSDNEVDYNAYIHQHIEYSTFCQLLIIKLHLL